MLLRNLGILLSVHPDILDTLENRYVIVSFSNNILSEEQCFMFYLMKHFFMIFYLLDHYIRMFFLVLGVELLISKSGLTKSNILPAVGWLS